MMFNKYGIFVVLALLFTGCTHVEEPGSMYGATVANKEHLDTDPLYLSYIADPVKDNIAFYWRDDNDSLFRSIGNLKNGLQTQKKSLLFAMNGGMYQEDNTPQGLFIEAGKIKEPLNRNHGEGNFYLKPNGVFLLRADGEAEVVATESYKHDSNIAYATQSGPMLLIGGAIHSKFKQGSLNVHIRNGVGILPDGKVLFVISRKPVNLYDFAAYFKGRGCKNALYLDGFVSRCYLPEKDWMQTDGNFGVIIGITQ